MVTDGSLFASSSATSAPVTGVSFALLVLFGRAGLRQGQELGRLGEKPPDRGRDPGGARTVRAVHRTTAWAVVTMTRVDLAGKLENARARVEAEAPDDVRGLAKFARLARKDARIRADQDAALTALTKILMRRRHAKSERITENTLIRVAIDLLLAHAADLRGSTEDELRNSVIPAVPEFRTLAVPDSRASGLPQSGLSQSGIAPLPDSRDSAARQPRRPGGRDLLASDPTTPTPRAGSSRDMGVR